MLELFDPSQFQTWCVATNDLHQTAYRETSDYLHHFVPFATTPCATSRYYLYRHPQAGVCGSVELAQLATDRVVGPWTLRRGTWIIKDSYFFLPDDHLYSSGGRYEPLIRGFYQHVLKVLAGLSEREDLPFALTCHHSCHGDFTLLGDVEFVRAWTERDWLSDRQAFFGLIRLSDQPTLLASQVTPEDTSSLQRVIPSALKIPFAPESSPSLNRG